MYFSKYYSEVESSTDYGFNRRNSSDAEAYEGGGCLSVILLMERWAWRRPPKQQWSGGGSGGGHREQRSPSSVRISLTTPLLLVLMMMSTVPVGAVVPLFHEATKMSGLRLPAETDIDTIVYRLRASDAEKDYPLIFGIRG